MTISKIDSDKVTVTQAPTNLRLLTRNILESFEYQSEEKGLALQFEYDKKIPQLIMIDSLRISEILINLIGNSIKFTQTGSISLRVKQLDRNEKSLSLRFEVEDTGVGIPEDQKEVIFDEFSQVGDIYDNKQGTGLGLSIVKNILQLMDSTIHCESQKDIGSKFYFDLVLPKVPETKSSQNESDFEEKQLSAATEVLLVEDNKINQLVTKNLLKHIGCSCIIAENGYQAVEMTKNRPFDLILMDLNMPVMDGMQATLQIRKFNNNTPIIALTASELSEVANDCLKAGMNDMVNKPLNKDNLKEVILKNL